jgi:hypothetical protein
VPHQFPCALAAVKVVVALLRRCCDEFLLPSDV